MHKKLGLTTLKFMQWDIQEKIKKLKESPDPDPDELKALEMELENVGEAIRKSFKIQGWSR